MIYKIFTELDEVLRKRAERFVINHPNGSFFQSPSAYEFFQSVDGYEPVLISAEEENEIAGILSTVIIKEPGVKGYFSRRCIVWGGPVCSSKEVAKLLIEKLNNYLNGKVIYTEFRNLFDTSNLQDAFMSRGYKYEDRINYIVEIESVEANKKKLNESRRRQINKSIKTGTKMIEPEKIEQVQKFYLILKELYSTKVKKPLPSFDFFKKFFEQKGLGNYFLVEYAGKIIGGIMCPIYKETIYEWYVCGLDQEYKEQSPSVMATWAAIEYAAKNGLKYFDFMGAGRPDEDYGVREFKSKFGGNEVHYGRYIRINNTILYKIGKLGLSIYQKMKFK